MTEALLVFEFVLNGSHTGYLSRSHLSAAPAHRAEPREKTPFPFFKMRIHPRRIRNARSVFFGVAAVLGGGRCGFGCVPTESKRTMQFRATTRSARANHRLSKKVRAKVNMSPQDKRQGRFRIGFLWWGAKKTNAVRAFRALRAHGW